MFEIRRYYVHGSNVNGKQDGLRGTKNRDRAKQMGTCLYKNTWGILNGGCTACLQVESTTKWTTLPVWAALSSSGSHVPEIAVALWKSMRSCSNESAKRRTNGEQGRRWNGMNLGSPNRARAQVLASIWGTEPANKPRRLGYPIFSGRVIQNSGNETATRF
jgi:hypothetical protein